MSKSILEELNKAKSDLKKGEDLQTLMKNANAVIRTKKPDVHEKLLELGLSEANAKTLMEPDFMKRIGFAQYRLTNNNANNKRLRDRVVMLEAKWKGARSDKEEKYTFTESGGGEILVNYDQDRVQILFPGGGRVDKDLYKQLRSNGYVFSRTNEAFQRKITPQAIRNAVRMFNATKVDPIQLEKGIETEKEHETTLENLSKGKIDVPEAIEEIATTHIAENANSYTQEPNTEDEFDQAILSKIEPHDGWRGNITKERVIKKQILDQLTGPDEEKESETERLFEKYKSSVPLPKFDTKQEFPNQYALNKAIESMLVKGSNSTSYSVEEKTFMRKYSGYGGLDKFGPTGKGGFFEFYTPIPVIKKMWALAYKNGYNNGPVLEPSCGTGDFFQFAKPGVEMVGYEISEYSSKISQILYPNAKIINTGFEQAFISSKNWTVKDDVEPLFDLVIGNPPYGDFTGVASRYFAMGELDHVGAKNYQEYFIRRSLDLLKPGGLLVFIVGASLQSGGILFLDSGPSRVKEYLASKSELLDAYRLPEDVFERTKVTSEIIVIKKL